MLPALGPILPPASPSHPPARPRIRLPPNPARWHRPRLRSPRPRRPSPPPRRCNPSPAPRRRCPSSWTATRRPPDRCRRLLRGSPRHRSRHSGSPPARSRRDRPRRLDRSRSASCRNARRHLVALHHAPPQADAGDGVTAAAGSPLDQDRRPLRPGRPAAGVAPPSQTGIPPKVKVAGVKVWQFGSADTGDVQEPPLRAHAWRRRTVSPAIAVKPDPCSGVAWFGPAWARGFAGKVRLSRRISGDLSSASRRVGRPA